MMIDYKKYYKADWGKNVDEVDSSSTGL